MIIRGKRKAYNFIAVKWDGSQEALEEIIKLTGKKGVLYNDEKTPDYIDYILYDKKRGVISFYASGFGYMAGILNEVLIKSEDDKFNFLPETVFNNHFDVEGEYPKYDKGEPVIYQNGDVFELGIIKSVCENDEYFINYHTGDTASKTHARNLHKIENKYAFEINRLKVDE